MESKGLIVKAGQRSEKGIKERNEDCCGIMLPEEPLLSAKGVTAIVADGVSCCQGGRESSESCVRGFLNDYYSTPESWDVKTSGQRVLIALNRWLYGEGLRRYSDDFTMLTTLSALVIKSTTAHLFHVGDTRIYRLRQGDFECLTRDHHRRLSNDRDVLSRAMGADPEVIVDYQSVAVEEGDLFFLSTDGIHGYRNIGEIKKIIEENIEDPEHAARLIVNEAIVKGSKDNATCQIILVKQLPHQNSDELSLQSAQLPFPPSPHHGMKFDGFRILRELGEKNESGRYLAKEEASGNIVVIRVPLTNDVNKADYTDRFLHEEWAGRRINHQNVLKVQDSGKRHFLYYVTEYAEGQSLRQWMMDGPAPSLTEVRNIIEQLASGLKAFHRLEMIHNDLRPENIIIDKEGTVKIVDFSSIKVAGLEKIIAPPHDSRLPLSLDYRAPECSTGTGEDEKSDLYALGVIAYEMLTGHLPYKKAKSGKKQRIYRWARYYNPALPLWVDKTIKKAVAVDPLKRYEEISQFIHDLSKPNPVFAAAPPLPLLKRQSLYFWRGLAIVELVWILILLCFVV